MIDHRQKNAFREAADESRKKAKIKIELRDGRKLKGYMFDAEHRRLYRDRFQKRRTTTVFYKDIEKAKKQRISTTAKIGIAGAVFGGILITVFAIGVKDLSKDLFRSRDKFR